jgi:hypothetical protein
MKMYATASLSEVDGEKLAYFVLSILWRGSVHSWKWGKDKQRTDSLGRRYEEEFRKYLVGESSFPNNAAVHVFLLTKQEMCNGFTIPFRQKLSDGSWRYTFNFLGISFRCYLGNALTDSVRRGCIYRSAEKYIFVGELADEVLVRDFAPTLIKSRPIGRIRKG